MSAELLCRFETTMYDLIGDIHGHADALQQLLAELGYTRQKRVYRHPDRQAIFLGDFIDRGPKIRETLEIVRPMIDSGAALAVMGNHELNALAFHTADHNKPGEHLRPHNEKNSLQHAETVRQVSAGELASYLDWFRTLPLWLDLDGLRVVHACWDETRMGKISGPVTDEFLHAACSPKGSLFEPVEAILNTSKRRLRGLERGEGRLLVCLSVGWGAGTRRWEVCSEYLSPRC